MFYLKPVGRIMMVAMIIMPTLALSEPVTLGYFARVELVMIDAEKAHFECVNNDLPARVEIDESTFGSTYADFPLAFLNRPMPPQIGVRRWGELVPERADRTLNRFTNDWHMTVAGVIDFCVGPATLQVMQGRLDVFAQLGHYEGNIFSSDDVLQDLDIKYETYASGVELADFFNPTRDGFPAAMNGQFVGPSPDGERDKGRILGRLDFDGRQLAIRFTSPNSRKDITQVARLNIRLILEGAGSAPEFPNDTGDEIIGNDG